MSSILKNAINNLGRYFDLSHGKDVTSNDASQQLGPAEIFLGAHTTIPMVETLDGVYPWEGATAGGEIDKEKLKFVVTRYTPQETSNMNDAMMAQPYGAVSEQGAYKPKESGFYCVKNDLLVNPSENATPMHVIQNFDVFSTVSSNDTSVVSFLMNGVSTIEWTRSTVMLEVGIRTTKGTQSITTNFLSRDGKTGPRNRNSETEPVEDSGESQTPFDAGSMDIFTMPQTLVNMNPVLEAGGIQTLQDPFRPLASVLDFKTSMSGFIARGSTGARTPMLKEKKASLRLMCHNQSYMSYLAPLVRPDKRGETLIVIRYGWAHPDGQRLGRASDAQKNNDTGIVIDHCQVSEAYTILDSRVSFNESGEASIDLDLAFTSVGTGLVDAKLGSSSDSTTGTELKQQIEGMVDLFAMNNQGRAKADFHLKGFLSSLENDVVLSSTAADSLREYRAAVMKALKDEKFSTDRSKVNIATTGVEHLQELFKQFFGEKNSTAFLKAATKSNPNSTVDGIMNLLTKTSDPYLRSNNPNNPANNKGCPTAGQMAGLAAAAPSRPTYVSFGKIVTTLIGPAFQSLPNYDEIQIIFHPFNDSSGAVHTFNIAQFPIGFNSLKKWLKSVVKERGLINTNEFLNGLANEFIHVGGNSSAYGIKGLKTLEDIDERLFNIYQIQATTQQEFAKSSLSPEFVNPRISIFAQAGPARNTLDPTVDPSTEMDATNPAGKTILRVHFVDTEFTGNKVFREALNAAQTTGVFPKRPRNATEKITSVDHNSIDSRALKLLQEEEIIKEFSEETGPDGSPSTLQQLINDVQEAFDAAPQQEGESNTVTVDEPVKAMTKEYNFLNDQDVSLKGETVERLKTLAQKELPGYILTGIEGTGVLSSKVQTTQDQRTITLSLLDTRTPAQREFDRKEGRKVMSMSVLPVEVDLEIMGCPFIHPGQEYLIDLKTGTNLDQFYRVLSVSHDISQGQFKTSVKLAPAQAGPRYQSVKGDMTAFVASRIKSLAG